MCVWYKGIQTLVEEIACDENTATFRFTIRDTGIGMSEDFVKNAFSEDVERSRKAGMTEHLSKPLNAETLKKAILRNI